MNGIEIETPDGWQRVPCHVISLGGGRFRANLRMPCATQLVEPKLRFRGQPIRPLAKNTIVNARRRFDTVVIDFSTAS